MFEWELEIEFSFWTAIDECVYMRDIRNLDALMNLSVAAIGFVYGTRASNVGCAM